MVCPAGDTTRPTSDRVREALFDALSARLGTTLGGGRVLDLYAGTGALGLEALSRGASAAVFVENDRAALRSLELNISRLGVGQRCTVIAGDAGGAGMRRAAALGPFALLLLDPPYRIDQSAATSAVSGLDRAGALTEDVLVVYEHAASIMVASIDGLCESRTYTYGETAVTLLGRREGAS